MIRSKDQNQSLQSGWTSWIFMEKMMVKRLSEMTLEELWQLFSVILTVHQECWEEWYLTEEALLRKVLPRAQRICHIGSTAIPSIWAKPIIDIPVEIPKESDLSAYKDLITHHLRIN